MILKAGTKLLEDVEKQVVYANERQWSKIIPRNFHPIPAEVNAITVISFYA